MKKTIVIICALLGCLFLTSYGALAAGPDASEPVALAGAAPAAVAQAELANLYGFTGDVEVETEGETMPAYEGMRLYGGDILRTGKCSTASLDLDQGRLLMLGENAELQLKETSDGGLEAYLEKGTIINDVAKGQAAPYTVRAGNVTMGVLGTVFKVSIDDATGVAVTELYEGKLLLTFTTTDGQEHSFVLDAGRRFTADSETLDGSAQQGGLITGDIGLSDLSPALLNMLEKALREREDAPDITELLEQIEALRRDPNCNCSCNCNGSDGCGDDCNCDCAFCSAKPAIPASNSYNPPPAPKAPEVTAFRLVLEEMEDGCVILSDYPSILSHAYRIEAKFAANDGEIINYTIAENYREEDQRFYTEILDEEDSPTGLFYYNFEDNPNGNIDGFTPWTWATVYLIANCSFNNEDFTIYQMMDIELGGLELYKPVFARDDDGNIEIGDIVIQGNFYDSEDVAPPATLSGELNIDYYDGEFSSDMAISNEPPDPMPADPTQGPNFYDPESGDLVYNAENDATLGADYQAAVAAVEWSSASVTLTYDLTSAYQVTELNEAYFDPESSMEDSIVSVGDWQTVTETVTETIIPPLPEN